MTQKALIFDATNGSSPLYSKLLASGRYEQGNLVRKVYGDGEIGHFLHPDVNQSDGAHPSFKGTVRGREVVVIGDLSSPEQVIDTYDVCNTAFDETAAKLTIVVSPATLTRDRFQRRVLIDLLASVPSTPAGNQLVLADAAEPGSPDYTPLRRLRRRAGKTAVDLLSNDSKPILLYTSSYEGLARKMMAIGNFEWGEVERTEVNGKPFFKKLGTNVHGRRVIVVSGTINAQETMELHYLAQAVALAGALERDIIISYYMTGTMERKTKSGEAVKAKIRARQLSALAPCPLGNRVIFCDLHSEGIPYYLEGGMQSRHVYLLKHLVACHARTLCGLEAPQMLGLIGLKLPAELVRDITLSSTDAGRAKWVDSMGLDCGLDTASGRKERLGDGLIVFLGALGPIFNRRTILSDDKCGTGGTVIKAGQGIRIDQYGRELLAKVGITFDADGKPLNEITLDTATDALVPHMVTEANFSHFVGDAAVVEKMLAARDLLGRPVFSKIEATDSHPNADKHHDGKRFITRSIAPLLVEAVSA
ncbi:MAG TPA: ribose-phosphate pyrophosphokinase-like domain-containing protein [Planktothrix sp.]|jgi:ribose-phosphate pyrophosphokinase